MSLHPPFVLLDDARGSGAGARLYTRPIRVVTAHTLAEVRPALAALRAAAAEGLHAAGWLAYEAGAALVDRTSAAETAEPLLWFGLFDGYQSLAADEVPALLPDPAGAWAAAPQPVISRDSYGERLARAQALIEAGDIYQANLTFQAAVPFAGHPHALYARLRRAAAAGYGALIDTGERQLLSLSPELFVELKGGALTCRPMKGTARRGSDAASDVALAEALAGDPKQRAENLMIVDLMRNDLSRVAAPGSVAVPALFTVETFPTIHQMTSTVTARLAPERDGVDVLEALFPCGSITGAPKQRAMQVIADCEEGPRGAYTGAIGRLDAHGDAQFNVAIRTLTIRDDQATMGLGSGIVADSREDGEWAESLAKGAFVAAGGRRVDLIETMAFDPDDGIALLDRHLARLTASAVRLGFRFDRHAARNELQAATFRLRQPMRVRLLLAAGGAMAVEVAPVPPSPSAPVEVAVVPLPVDPSDFRLRHKTSDRRFYDKARNDAGCFEVVFQDGERCLTEGSFTSLFVPRGDVLVTPPLSRGLLPGVLRAELIGTGRAVEGDLTRDDLAGGFFVGNALRGLIPAVVAVAKEAAPR